MGLRAAAAAVRAHSPALLPAIDGDTPALTAEANALFHACLQQARCSDAVIHEAAVSTLAAFMDAAPRQTVHAVLPSLGWPSSREDGSVRLHAAVCEALCRSLPYSAPVLPADEAAALLVRLQALGVLAWSQQKVWAEALVAAVGDVGAMDRNDRASDAQAQLHAVACTRAAAITASASLLLPLPPHDPSATESACAFFSACADCVEHENRMHTSATVPQPRVPAADAAAISGEIRSADAAVVTAAAAALAAMARRLVTCPAAVVTPWIPVLRRCATVCDVVCSSTQLTSSRPFSTASVHCRDALHAVGAIIESLAHPPGSRSSGVHEPIPLPHAPRLQAAPSFVVHLVHQVGTRPPYPDAAGDVHDDGVQDKLITVIAEDSATPV